MLSLSLQRKHSHHEIVQRIERRIADVVNVPEVNMVSACACAMGYKNKFNHFRGDYIIIAIYLGGVSRNLPPAKIPILLVKRPAK